MLTTVDAHTTNQCNKGGGVAAQQLGALVLLEDLGLVPSAHVVAHNHQKLQLQGIQCPLLAYQ